MVAGLDELRTAVTVRIGGAILLGATALLSCGPAEGAPARGGSHGKAEAAASALPSVATAAAPAPRPYTPNESLALFRAGLVAPPRLTGGAMSRDALVRRFARAVERRDTAAIRAMVLNRAEFAYLYYPSSPYARPPTVQEAPLAWFLLIQNSQIGLTRVFDRLGGQKAVYLGHRCDPEPSREGANLFWRECVVDLKTPGQGAVTRKLFGSIIERNGHFKFFSYTNDF